MHYSLRVRVSLILAGVLCAGLTTAIGQSASAPATAKTKTSTTAKSAAAPTVTEQLQQLNDRLAAQQSQIQQQQSQIQQLQQTNTHLQQQVEQQGQTLQSSVQQAAAAQDGVNSLHTTVTDIQSTTQATSNALLANKKSVDALENPVAIHYKGITITPGGWLESTFFVAGRNENIDLTSNFGAVPFNGVANSNLTSFGATARGSRPIVVATANAGSTKLTGYWKWTSSARRQPPISSRPTASHHASANCGCRQTPKLDGLSPPASSGA